MSFWAKTDDLRSTGNPMIEIVNAMDDKTITRSEPFASGTSDWKQFTVRFTAPPGSEAVSIRTIRQYCGDNCPISGSVWLDEFKLQKEQ